MIPVQFEYAAPESLDAALNLLQQYKNSQILAGPGLLLELKLGNISPSLLVDIRKISTLQGVKFQNESNGVVQIGTMTTYAETAASPKIRENYQALADAASSIGDAQIRNRGTIGDIFAYRDLACDLLAVALAFDAIFNISSPKGNHTVPAEEFIAASFRTTQEFGEIVTSIDFPPYLAGAGSAYEKFKHPASQHTICGVAVFVSQSSNGEVDKCRVAYTGTNQNTTRLSQVELALEGKIPTQENVADAAKLATKCFTTANEDLMNSSDPYGSPEYVAHLRGVLTARALTVAIKRSSK